MTTYFQGDIHEVIKTLEDNTIDFIYTDPPFNITQASWDKPLRWKELFPEMWRVLKPEGIICLYASLPFTYELLQYEKPKYHYNWKKNITTNFFHAKKQPLRQMEEIFIYYKKVGTYNPQMVGDTFYKKDVAGTNGMGYCNIGDKGSKKSGKKYNDKEGHTGKYPTTFKEWKVRKDSSGITRDDEQIDYFIKTYSNENDTILDMTCHNGYVGDRCSILNRNYIGVDLIF
jgi:site-specific DNA-methyltransferase (adenine-specific)